jgi:hypothetical protein
VARGSYPGNSTFLEQSSELFVLGRPEGVPCTVAYSTRTTHNAIHDFSSLMEGRNGRYSGPEQCSLAWEFPISEM